MFGVIHMDASGEDNPSLECLPSLYDELFTSGITDGNVSVINDDTGWSLSAYRDKRLVFEHLGEGGQRHMIPVEKSDVLRLWKKLIDGDIEDIRSEAWKPGYK